MRDHTFFCPRPSVHRIVPRHTQFARIPGRAVSRADNQDRCIKVPCKHSPRHFSVAPYKFSWHTPGRDPQQLHTSVHPVSSCTNPRPTHRVAPCTESSRSYSSSESKSVLSNSSRRVRIRGVKPRDYGCHMVTKDDRDRREGQEWIGDEESREGEGRA